MSFITPSQFHAGRGDWPLRPTPTRPTPSLPLSALSLLAMTVLALWLSLASATAWAAPGAHGPDGEHLSPTGTTATGGASAPQMETQTETFELVAQLQGGELAVFINLFQTNAPVLGAKVEVESGALKAVAQFQDNTGSYVVTDAALLQALQAPGEHALVITVLAEAGADLLTGTLPVPALAPAHDHAHDLVHLLTEVAVIGLAVLLLLGAGFWLARRYRQNRGVSQ